MIVPPEPSFIGPGTKPQETSASSGPITSQSQVDARSPSAPTSPSQVDVRSPSGPITSPSQVDARSPSGPIMSPSQVDVRSPSGPITSPSQVDVTGPGTPAASPSPPPAVASAPTSSPQRPGAFATSAGVRRFDPVFERYRGSIPIEYVRALVERESGGHSDARNGEAIGLMQIRPAVLADYNKRHGTSYASAHLVDPATNVALGCELLRLIIDSYRHHPKLRSLQVDWNSSRFVELLTFGWNAGFSEAGGVGRVAAYLELLSAVDTNIDQVSTFAEHAGASKHLSSPARVAWCKSVAALYVRERAFARLT